ncbi:hypothetical protein VTN00DRAFT_7688 [Thermoascus crustaceus]|uniref:uncharacterized protein n=1 Tax=Thermoascus crustaceus TaxID=5088 RepID=UPI00374302C9
MLLIYEDRQQTRRLERLDELPQPFHGIATQRQAVAGGRTPAQARRFAFARRRDAEADGRPLVMYLVLQTSFSLLRAVPLGVAVQFLDAMGPATLILNLRDMATCFLPVTPF